MVRKNRSTKKNSKTRWKKQKREEEGEEDIKIIAGDNKNDR